MQFIVVFLLLSTLGLALAFPRQAMVLWILVLETSPDAWANMLAGGQEMLTAGMKGYGLVLVLAIGLRHGWRLDRFNPAFAFVAMFLIGIIHGLYPGLTLTDSLRSLIGSASPFLFSFIRLPLALITSINRTLVFAPLGAIAFGAILSLAGLDTMYGVEQGAIRLGTSGEAPYLAGFALIAIYAGWLEFLKSPCRRSKIMLAVNLSLLLLTGARAPLLLAGLVTILVLITQRRILALAGLGALTAIACLCSQALSFLRVFNLIQLGEASDLSNRTLVWPFFAAAWAASPLFGQGIGAGKVIMPLSMPLAGLIGTNAAHDEFLRIGAEGGIFGLLLLITLIILWLQRGTAPLPRPQKYFVRLVFLAFAVHSATDNTMIATTSSAFFLWASTVFMPGRETQPARTVMQSQPQHRHDEQRCRHETGRGGQAGHIGREQI
jgi:O-antigen ligase